MRLGRSIANIVRWHVQQGGVRKSSDYPRYVFHRQLLGVDFIGNGFVGPQRFVPDGPPLVAIDETAMAPDALTVGTYES